MKLARLVGICWYGAVAAIVLVCIAAPLLTPATPANPSGNAGLSAPILALCAGALALAQALRPGDLALGRAPAICAGVASLGSAYMWIADAAGTHPATPALPGLFWLMLGLTAVALGGIFFTRRG